MAKLILDSPRRLWRTLRTWPHLGGWWASLEFSVIALLLIAMVGFGAGYYRPGHVNLDGMPLRLLSVLFVPALGEEAVFRGLLLPDESEIRRPWAWLLGSTAVYSAWHVLEAATFMRFAWPVFTRPDFLLITFILGLACGLMRWRTGSLWPAVFLHWLLVTLWQTFLGGITLP